MAVEAAGRNRGSWRDWPRWSEKAQKAMLQVDAAARRAGFKSQLVTDWGDVTEPQIQLYHPGEDIDINLFEEAGGNRVEIAQFKDNGDIETLGYRRSFAWAARKVAADYRGGKIKKG